MPILVMKFGGTSVADPERILNAAQKVKREVDAGWQVAVVVSAMSGETQTASSIWFAASRHSMTPANTTRWWRPASKSHRASWR